MEKSRTLYLVPTISNPILRFSFTSVISKFSYCVCQGVINPADFGSYVKDTEDAHDDKLPTHFTPMLYDLQPYARCNAEIIPILNRFPCRSGSDLAISSTSDSSNSTDVSSLCVCNHKGNTIDIPSYAEYTTASPHIPLHKGHDTTRASSNANSDPPCRCQSRTPTKGLIGHTPFKSAAPGVGHGEEFRVLEQELMSLQLDSGELDLKAFNALGF